jgi:hypothetical protein
MENQSQPELPPAILAGASDFECLSGNPGLTYLSAKRTTEIEHAIKSGAKMKWGGNCFHMKNFIP